MGGRAVAYATRQTVYTVDLTSTQNQTKPKTNSNLIKGLVVGGVAGEGELSHQKQDFEYGRHQRSCRRNIPILLYKAPWDSLAGKHHMNTSIFISRGRSQIVDVSAWTLFQPSTGSKVLRGSGAAATGLQPPQQSVPCCVPPFPLPKVPASSICLCSHRLQYGRQGTFILVSPGWTVLSALRISGTKGKKVSECHRRGKREAVALWHKEETVIN